MVKFIGCLLIIPGVFIVSSGCSHLDKEKDVLFQVSSMNAILQGDYEGKMTCGELKKHGDFAIGAFEGLDGEVFALGSKFYQIKPDSTVQPVDNSHRVTFALVTFFEPDREEFLEGSLDYKRLTDYINVLLPKEDIIYAIRIEGFFKYIKTRSIPRQSKPYLPFEQVLKDQNIYEFHDIEGTIVGFRLPAYLERISTPGYHLHFISKDKKAGGHVVDCLGEELMLQLDHTYDFLMEINTEDLL